MPTEMDVERCVSCFGKAFSFERNYATFIYEDLVRDLLLDLKFNCKKQIAYSLGKLWAKHVGTAVTREIFHCSDSTATASTLRRLAESRCVKNSLTTTAPLEGTYLVPLPMHPKKQRERGFNQAEVLAKAVGERLGIPVVNALERVLDTPPQSGLHLRQRVENIQGAFGVAKSENPQDKHYIVVDDIYTTGASLNECARVLKEAGASSVCGLTLSVVKKKKEKD